MLEYFYLLYSLIIADHEPFEKLLLHNFLFYYSIVTLKKKTLLRGRDQVNASEQRRSTCMGCQVGGFPANVLVRSANNSSIDRRSLCVVQYSA